MKKLFSLLLVLALCLSLFPAAAALAEEPAGADAPVGPEETTPPSSQGDDTSPYTGEAETDPDALPPAEDEADALPPAEDEADALPPAEDEADALPPAADEIQDTVASGECGDSLIWTLSSTGILTIAGSGDMWDFKEESTEDSLVSTAPWYDRREEIKTVRILQGVTSIGNFAFMDCSSMTDITIPEGVTRIGDEAFSSCNGLTSITIPVSVTGIGYEAFYYCASLSSITIPEGVTYIGNSVFDCCFGLTSLSIPASLTGEVGLSIDYCDSLTDIYYGDTKAAWTQLGMYYDHYRVTVHCSDVEIAAADSSACGDDLIWTLSSDGVLTIAGTGDMWDYNSRHRVPWYDNGLEIKTVRILSGVTGIGETAFYRCENLTQVTIPEGVTRIGDSAFSSCSALTSVTLPESVTSIGSSAFSSCERLTSMTIPAGVTAISDYTFYQCDSLTEITIPAGVTSIGNYAFGFCSGLTEITLPANLTSIGHHGFYFCNRLIEVTIPEGVTTIGRRAFDDCSALTRVSLPASLVDWNPTMMFEFCSSLAEIQVAEANPAYCAADNIVYDKAMETLLLCPAGKTGSVTIPASVKTVVEYAFYECGALTEIRFEGPAPSFGAHSFYGVRATAYYPRQESSWTAAVRQSYSGTITWVAYGPIASGQCGDDLTWTLEENGTLTISGTGDMWNWSNIDLAPWWSYGQYEITALDIQPGVTGIGEYAFHSCGKLTEITVPEGVTRIGYAAFSSCNSLTSVTLPASLTETGNDLFRSCDSLTDIYFGGTRAMWSQLNMPYDHYSITVHCSDGDIAPADVMYCGDNLIWTLSSEGVLTVAGSGSMWNFDDGHAPWAASLGSIKSVRIISGATSIGSNAFARCDALTSVTIPEGVTSIGRGAFYACYGLTGVTIPESVTRIGRSAFNGCYGLTSVTIPKNVTAIGEYAFGSCGTLTEIRFEGSAPSFGELCFSVVTATAYYPQPDPSWTEEVRQNYGGNITWEAYGVEPSHTPGDINGDGKVNNKDANRLQRYLKDPTTEVNAAALDVNGDGTVNNKDLIRLMRYLKYGDVEIH